MDASGNSETIALLAAAGAAAALVAALVAVILLVRLRRAQRIVLGSRQRDLVTHAADLQREFGVLQEQVDASAEDLRRRVASAEERLAAVISLRGLIRYDAYGEMSGRQSFSLALLDSTHSGIVLSAIHHREQARLYTKHVTAGQGDIPLTPEEHQAIELAIAGSPPPLPDAVQ